MWFTEEPVMDLAEETCGVCGSEFEYYGVEAREALSEWRVEHKCFRVKRKDAPLWPDESGSAGKHSRERE